MVPLYGVDENGEHTVCGLHAPINLSIVKKQFNGEKSNKWKAQSFDEFMKTYKEGNI
jgi:predicted GNAT superfamily acetyltransferase